MGLCWCAGVSLVSFWCFDLLVHASILSWLGVPGLGGCLGSCPGLPGSPCWCLGVVGEEACLGIPVPDGTAAVVPGATRGCQCVFASLGGWPGARGWMPCWTAWGVGQGDVLAGVRLVVTGSLSLVVVLPAGPVVGMQFLGLCRWMGLFDWCLCSGEWRVTGWWSGPRASVPGTGWCGWDVGHRFGGVSPELLSPSCGSSWVCWCWPERLSAVMATRR